MPVTDQDMPVGGGGQPASITDWQTLRERERLYRVFFENSQGLLCMHDLKGRLIKVNQASAASLGYIADELTGRYLSELLAPPYTSLFAEYLKAIREQTRLTGVMHLQHRDGSGRIWLFNNVLDRSETGEVFVIGSALDITQRYSLEADLRTTKQMLEQTSTMGKIGGWEYQVDTGQIYWSHMTKSIHELPVDYEPRLENVLSFYKNNGSRQQIEGAIQLAISQGNSYDLELQLKTATGRDIWVRAIGNAEFRDGRCIRLYGTFQDINDRKLLELGTQQARRLLEEVLQSASEVSIIATDKTGLITVFNRGAENMLGYTADEMIGRQSPSLIHDPLEVMAREKELSRQLQTPVAGFQVFVHIAELKGSEQREWSYIRKDGSRLTVTLLVTPMRDNEQQVTGYLGIAIDISERKAVEKQLAEQRTRLSHFVRQLRNAKIQAEAASVAKSEFLANMSHEIRTPLNGIIGFTDLVLKTSLNETQQQYITLAHQSAGILLNIINDILDFSKIESGKLELDIARTALYDTCDQVSDLIKYQAQSKGLEMLFNISPELPQYIWADQLRTKQVLVNLLSNAVKFTEKGEVSLSIFPLTALNEGRIQIRFEVQDTGIGIPPERQQKIFEAFSQEDASVTKKYGGTGLGLTISNKLLSLMNSSLQLRSEPGKGSTFFFDLEVQAEYGELEIWQQLPPIRRVLIVDDNDSNRMILERMLLMKSIASDQVSNGFEALQRLIAGERYDVVMIDYHMAIMDGLETIRKMRELETGTAKTTPVMLLHSSSDDEKVLRICKEWQVWQRLVKPIKMQDLYQALSRLHKGLGQEEVQTDAPATLLAVQELTVLLVEDNRVNLLLARTILGRVVPQARVVEAHNGFEAVAQFPDVHPHVILMDIQMPEMDGYEATRRIRQQEAAGSHVPIIALTAGNVKGEEERCLAAGMDDFIAKPFVEATLVAALSKWLGSGYAPDTGAAKVEVLDLTVMKQYLGEDAQPALLWEALRLAAVECVEILDELERLVSIPGPGPIKACAHRLYGIASYTGMEELASRARTLERAGDEAVMSLTHELLPALQKAIQTYTFTLRQHGGE